MDSKPFFFFNSVDSHSIDDWTSAGSCYYAYYVYFPDGAYGSQPKIFNPEKNKEEAWR